MALIFICFFIFLVSGGNSTSNTGIGELIADRTLAVFKGHLVFSRQPGLSSNVKSISARDCLKKRMLENYQLRTFKVYKI